MKLSTEAKRELLVLSKTDEFKRIERHIFADNPGTPQATNQFTDFIQFLHRMAGHPLRTPKPIEGDFIL